MFYTPKFFKDNLPKQKWNSEPIACKLFFRPLSYLFSSIFASIGLTANFVSIINILVASASCILLFFNNYICNIVSASLFMLWISLDCVDGNIARCIKMQKYGDYLDAISGYILTGFYLIGLGYNCFLNGGFLDCQGNVLCLLFPAISSVAFVMLLLFKKKYNENSLKYEESSQISSSKKDPSFPVRFANYILSELSSGGIMSIVVLVAFIFNFVDAIVAFYSILYFIMFVFGSMFLLLKTIKANR